MELNSLKMLLIKIILIVAVFLTSCGSNSCEIAFKDFNLNKSAPIIYITSRKDNCQYFYSGEFWVNNSHFISNGELFLENKVIYLALDSMKNKHLKYFDFNTEKGGSYLISFNSGRKITKTTQQEVQIEDVISVDGGEDVFLFRIIGGFVYEGESSDIIFFVSVKRGVIGSYVSERNNNGEIIAVERGDILRAHIDYSKKQFGTLR